MFTCSLVIQIDADAFLCYLENALSIFSSQTYFAATE